MEIIRFHHIVIVVLLELAEDFCLEGRHVF